MLAEESQLSSFYSQIVQEKLIDLMYILQVLWDSLWLQVRRLEDKE